MFSSIPWANAPARLRRSLMQWTFPVKIALETAAAPSLTANPLWWLIISRRRAAQASIRTAIVRSLNRDLGGSEQRLGRVYQRGACRRRPSALMEDLELIAAEQGCGDLDQIFHCQFRRLGFIRPFAMSAPEGAVVSAEPSTSLISASRTSRMRKAGARLVAA